MSLERAPLEHEESADWFAPIAVLIAWVAHLFEQIAKLKRIRQTTRFKANWRDHWPKLRQCEWMRDQILAAGAAQLLAGNALDLSDFVPSTEPPADYGGPCPSTPFEMNRRVLAFARWNADPETAIHANAQRIARCANIDLDNPLAAHGSTDASLCAAAHHEPVSDAAPEALILSRPRSGRPSTCRAEAARRRKDERVLTGARGPPGTPNPDPPTSRQNARTPPLARSPEPAYPPNP